MDITEVRVKLLPRTRGNDKLRAFCTITFDAEFVVRDVKIIESAKGPFIAMPSRKLMDRCQRCRHKNTLRARYCNDCGVELSTRHMARDRDGRTRYYVDIAHPINSDARRLLHEHVMNEFRREEECSKEEGYVFASIDDDAGDFDDFSETGAEMGAEV